MKNLDIVLKSRDITFATKVHIVKAMVFLVVLYECERWTIKKVWVPKNWYLQTVVLEKTLESPLDSKIKPVNHKGNQPWIFTGRLDAEAEAPILWPPDAKSQLIRKGSDAGKDGRQQEKWVTEDEMVGITDSMGMSLSKRGRWWGTGKAGVLQFMGSQIVRHNRATE